MLFRYLIGAALACALFPAAASANTLDVSLPVSQAATSGCRDATASEGSVPSLRLTVSTLCLINADRTAHGLKPLRFSRKLSRAALRHAQDMAAKGYFGHDEPSGRTLFDRARRAGYLRGSSCWRVSENLGWGRGPGGTPAAIETGWMGSPLHRDNILNGGFRHVGIAILQNDETGGITYVIDFGGC